VDPHGLGSALFVIDLRSRRVHVAGSTPTPDAWFMAQAARRLTNARRISCDASMCPFIADLASAARLDDQHAVDQLAPPG
jgi:hypothetical protein